MEQSGLDLWDTAQRYKMAAIVDQFDRETKLNRMYGDGGLDRPEEVMFKLTEKHAQDFLGAHIQLTSGTIYEKAAFAGLALNHVRDWLGQAFADEVGAGDLYVDPEKLADVAPTLPRGDAEMFDRMAQAGGVSAYAVTKAAADVGLTQEELYALAVSYGTEVPAGRPSVL